MAVVCVQEQGARVGRRGARLLVEKDGAELAEIQLGETTALAVVGGVQMGARALEWLLEEGISVLYFNDQGRLKAMVSPPGTPRRKARMLQYERCAEPDFVFEVSRRLVGARLLNAVSLLEGYIGEREAEELVPASEKLLSLAMRSAKAVDAQTVRECGTSGEEVFYSALPVPEEFREGWRGKLEWPARDAVNALLELGFALTMGEVRAQIEGLGLDPGVGVLDEAQEGCLPLAHDLMEPFRAAAADRLSLELMQSGMLEPGMFRQRTDGRGGMGLAVEALPLFLTSWDRILSAPIQNAPEGLRSAMGQQVDSFERALMGGTFEPFFLKI